jgi:hypothetical protein
MPEETSTKVDRTGWYVVVLMPEAGLFPLWSGGAMTPDGALKILGLGEELVAEIQKWGWEDDSTVPVPGGYEGWFERGVDLHRRIQIALGPEYDVEYRPGDVTIVEE